jgi:hypothetical protein
MPDPATRPANTDASSWDRTPTAFVALADAVMRRDATAAQAQEYGRHLFDALIGADGWSALTSAAAPGPLVVGLRWEATALHHVVWELLHDGQEFLALQNATPLVLVRLGNDTTASAPATIARLPRVLFAVGAANDLDLRAGAEVMGVLRGVERAGGSVSSRVLAAATLADVAHECDRNQPDIVHLIGHGRWDIGADAGRLTFQSESAGSEEHTGAEVAVAVGHPTLVVVSACDSGVARSEAGSPLAAELVASGVPIVIAMAGAISDTACRVFTRAVAAAVALGVPLVHALAQGRRASFAYTKLTPEKVDWALPAVFSRAPLDATFRLVDRQPIDDMRTWIERHDHGRLPLFAGRPSLLADLDELLKPQGNPGVLLLYSKYAQRVGGTSALRELAAEAVRLGHLPVRVGPFQQPSDAPTTFEAFIRAVMEQVERIADREGVDAPVGSLTELDAAVPATPAQRDRNLVKALRADLFQLRDRVATTASVLDPARPPVLLLDDVHLYDECLARLFAQLTGSGLGEAPTKLPVILFGKETAAAPSQLGELRDKKGMGIAVRELCHVADLPDDAYRAAFLCWMLNPAGLSEHNRHGVKDWPSGVLAPNDDSEQWIDFFRGVISGKDFYDASAHRSTIEFALKHGYLVPGDDDAIMQAIGMLP